MSMIEKLLLVMVAVSHIAFLVLEMFLWQTEIGRSVFSLTAEFAEQSAVLAMNQGLYNGFLAAGIIWGLIVQRPDIKVFFLVCILIAGVFGGLTAKPSIFYIQGLPALVALVVVLRNVGDAEH